MFFTHPSDILKSIYFADVPHLKLVRNNLFNTDFVLDSEIMNKFLQILEKLFKLNNNDLKIAFNLNRAYLYMKGFQRQCVLLAFSMRNAKTLEYCGKKGFLL